MATGPRRGQARAEDFVFSARRTRAFSRCVQVPAVPRGPESLNQIKQSVGHRSVNKSNRSIVQSANCTYTTKIKRSITVSYTATDKSHSPDQSRDRSQLVTEINRQQSANRDRNKQIRSLAVKCSDRFDHSQSNVATDCNDSVNYWSDNKIN